MNVPITKVLCRIGIYQKTLVLCEIHGPTPTRKQFDLVKWVNNLYCKHNRYSFDIVCKDPVIHPIMEITRSDLNGTIGSEITTIDDFPVESGGKVSLSKPTSEGIES